MIFIHGGHFTRCSSSDFSPNVLSTYGHTIIVTINYRLSVWGFLSTEDSNSPGNYGLWDQRMAEEWVHDNIAAFGGDSNRITIFGNSARAASVVYQGLYPRNKGLFQRIIAQSGSPAAFWAHTSTPRETADNLAGEVGCCDSNAAIMVDCLRSLSANLLNETILERHFFTPCIDNVFVTCNPMDILDLDNNSTSFQVSRDVFSTFDYMAGINRGEGIYALDLFFPSLDTETFLPNKTFFVEVFVPIVTNTMFGDQIDSETDKRVQQAIVSKYTDAGDLENPYRIREQILILLTDIIFLVPMHASLSANAQYGKSYMYYLSVKPSYHVLPTPKWFDGANHVDEKVYLFPVSFDLLDEEERILSAQMINMWTNFAKTGNPNEPRELGLTWKPYVESCGRYLELKRNITANNLKQNFEVEYTNFWNNVVTEIIGGEDEGCNYVYKEDTSSALKPVKGALPLLIGYIVFCHFSSV